MKRVLFVCTGNSCRSVMAEGLFKRAVADRAADFEVSSAGVAAMDGYPSTMETIRAMKGVGIDVAGHQSRRLTPELVREADHIYVMESIHRDMILTYWPEAAPKVRLLTEFSPDARLAGSGVPDPISKSDEFYTHVLKMIEGCIQKIVKSIGGAS